MTDTHNVSPTPMAEITVRLGDLGLAPENLRFHEPADVGVPQLAETILAAGVLYPPIVRRGRKDEKAFMTLEGRRRRFGLLLLRDRGDIDDDYPVVCKLAVTKAQQAAAIILPNAEVAPVHIANVIAAIGRLIKIKWDFAAVAAALGYDVAEIKRLAALSNLHPTVLKALREGEVTLTQARMMTRITSRDLQGQLAQTALDGYLSDYDITVAVNRDLVDVNDARYGLVGADAYLAAGGRIEADLFGDTGDRLLNPELLTDLWQAKIRPIIEALKSSGLAVYIANGHCYRAPDGYEHLPQIHANSLSTERRQCVDAAFQAAAEAGETVKGSDLAGDGTIELIVQYLNAERGAQACKHESLTLGAVILYPDADCGVAGSFFANPIVAEEGNRAGGIDQLDRDAEGDGENEAQNPVSRPCRADVEIPRANVDTVGANHAFHETRTDVATRGLMRDLADDPGTALTVLVAQLFKAITLQSGSSSADSALGVSAKAYHYGRRPPIAALDGEVRSRLTERKAAYLASGLRPIPWIDGLAHGEKMALLAELVAMSLDLKEPKTDAVRHGARAEATEISRLCGYNIALHWTPDEVYLTTHAKKRLSGLLDEMGAPDERAKTLRKDELVTFVAE